MSVFEAKRRLRDGMALLSGEPSDEAVNRAIDAAAAAQGALAAELADREAARVRVDQAAVVEAHAGALDRMGRSRAPVTLPGYRRGRSPANKGQRYEKTPPSVEEVMRMVACCTDDPHGQRLRAFLMVLWDGLRINEALHVTEHDIDPERSSILVRFGKGGKQRRVGMPRWFLPELQPWVEYRQTLPIGPLFCVITGPTIGRGWAAPDARKKLHELARTAGVRRRCAPHQLRHGCALRMRDEGHDIVTISRHLGHANLAITSIYLEGVAQDDIIESVSSQPVPQISALNFLHKARHEIAERSVTHVG